MDKTRQALKLALEALEYIHEGANNQGPHTGISWRCVSKKAEPAITAIREALADSALDRMAENARELGLDYEPPCKTGSQCTSKCQQCDKPAQQQDMPKIGCVNHDCDKCKAQQQEPVADSKAPMLSDWLQANYEADEIDEAAEELRRLFRENQLLWKEREEPHRQLEFYIRECNRLESERDAALTQPSQSQSDVKPWVGLTSQEVYACADESGLPQELSTGDLQAFGQAIEAKLKEKNA